MAFIIVQRGLASHPPQELTRADWPYGERLLAEKFVPGAN